TSPTARAAGIRSPAPNAPAGSSGHLPADEVTFPVRTETLERQIIRCNMTVGQLLPSRRQPHEELSQLAAIPRLHSHQAILFRITAVKGITLVMDQPAQCAPIEQRHGRSCLALLPELSRL